MSPKAGPGGELAPSGWAAQTAWGGAVGLDGCGERRVNRELVPIPFLPGPKSLLDRPKARKSQQRSARRNILTTLSNETIASLNSAAGFPTASPGAPSEAQRAAASRVWAAHVHLGPPPPDLTREAAFRELLATASGYAAQEEHATLGVYSRDRLARPSGSTRPVPLEKVLGGDALEHFLRFEERHLLVDENAAPLYEDERVIKPYWDPLALSGWNRVPRVHAGPFRQPDAGLDA